MPKNNFTFAVIGDIHYSAYAESDGRKHRECLPLIRDTVKAINESRVDFTISLGDIGDGRDLPEIPQMLEELKKLESPLYFTIGNHDLVLRNRAQLLALYGMQSASYDFKFGNTRFLFLDSLEVSRFSEPGENLERSKRFRKEHEFLKLRDWDGMLSPEAKKALADKLARAEAADEDTIIVTHVPVFPEASAGQAWMWDHRELLDIFDRAPHLRSVIAGHYHPGKLALRRGVIHKTVRAVCNSNVPTALIVHVEDDVITFRGIGEEKDGRFPRANTPYCLHGKAVPGAFITGSTGETAEADATGKFAISVPGPGMYAFRMVAENFADAVLPKVCIEYGAATLPELEFSPVPDPGRQVQRGDFGHYAVYDAAVGGKTVRSIDLAGTPFGSLECPGFWHEHSTANWTQGKYAVSHRPGETVEIQERPWHPDLRKRGYFKGDFHAHLNHGENFYVGNVPLSAFIARAEHYDWLYLAEAYGNDGMLHDAEREAQELSGPDLLLKLNTEFPKNLNGHVGNLGCERFYLPLDYRKVTNFELAEEYIARRNGIAVPVHVLFGDESKVNGISNMTGKEVFLWLLCNPDLCPALDIFYNCDTPEAIPFYHLLLKRGCRIALTCTSDAAFDVGRTPGDRGGLFVRMADLSEKSLLEGIRQRNTITSFEGAVVLPEIDGHGPGSILKPGSGKTLNADLWYKTGKSLILKVFVNGKLFHEETVSFAGGKTARRTLKLDVPSNGFVTVYAADAEKPQRILSAASAIYFRDETFRDPEVLEFPRPFPQELHDRLLHQNLKEIVSDKNFDYIASELKKYASKLK